MKKIALVFTLAIILAFASAPVSFANNSVAVIVNGYPVTFPDAYPYINSDNRTMVPVRFVSAQLGAEVNWDAAQQIVNILYNQRSIRIPIGKKFADVAGQKMELDTNAVIKDGRTMVPLRFVSEALGAQVLYNSQESIVRISNSTYNPISTQSRNNKYQSAPAMTIDPQKHYSAKVDTNRGSFTIELLAAEAPLTVNNFVFLAREGFYDGIVFHRIMASFMIQTGDPLGNGTGGPGYAFADELPPAQAYEPGIVAMANSGPNTNGSQFFICTGDDSTSLNSRPNYTVFGRVTAGMATIDDYISNTPVQPNSQGELSQPMEDVIIQHITISEKN